MNAKRLTTLALLGLSSAACNPLAKRLFGDADPSAADAAGAPVESGSLASAYEDNKLSVYVKCTNMVDERVRISMRGYESWAPSPKALPKVEAPSMVTFGDFYTDLCVAKVRESVGTATPPSLLDTAALEYAAVLSELLPRIDEGYKYYVAVKEYKDDAYAKGKVWHPLFVRDFARFRAASTRFNELVDQANDTRLAAQRAEVEKREGRKFRWQKMTLMASSKVVADLADDKLVPPAAFADAMTQLVSTNEAFDAYVKAHPEDTKDSSGWSWFSDAKDKFLGEARELARSVKSTKGKTSDRKAFFETYNELIERSNDLK